MSGVEIYPVRNAKWVRRIKAGIPIPSIARSERVEQAVVKGVWYRYENRLIRERCSHEA